MKSNQGYLSKAYFDFNMTDVKEIFIEVHERGQSFMNNKWGWDTNIALLTSGKFITKEYKVCIETKHLYFTFSETNSSNKIIS